jgi:CRISPR-associated protein Cas2
VDLLLAYDVATETAAGRRRLRKVAKICESFGVRVQYSVFDLVLEAHELEFLLHDLRKVVDEQCDGVRLYRLAGKEPVFTIGVQRSLSSTRGPLIV